MQFLARAVTNVTVIGSCLVGLSVGAGCGTRAGMGSAGDILPATVVESGNEDYVAVASQTREAGKWEFTVKPRNPKSNAALHFEWDFGDGELRVGPDQTYAFAEPGAYRVKVTGLDSQEKVIFTLTLEIEVSPFNRTPLADAGETQVVYANDLVFLDGTLSQDDDGDALTFHWAQLSGPEVQLTDAEAVVASFVAPMVESGEVRL
ncbi:MAG: PKD domain-containing protein, partial [Planctomycetes bacterium]|nr:PKD domain-containing protein [Planctomycetota bacterium]